MTFHAEIEAFIKNKSLSENSKSAYRYDLQQFCDFFATRDLTENTIALYRKQLSGLAPTAQKRKISACNQFLAHLYFQHFIGFYYKLAKADEKIEKSSPVLLHDFSSYYGPISSPGQFLACLILETGLTPSEICKLHWADFNWTFNVLEINFAGHRRVLPLQNKFAVRAKLIKNADELFKKTRQYLHGELKKFSPYTARELREQFILRRIKEGATIYQLSESLGLKTIGTLEKYYNQR